MDSLLAVLLGIILLNSNVECAAQRRRVRGGGGGSGGVEFDCPEEFGYYPHPTDCTQYYVCVFGGALLESCTGGLMYSHELQTCDWPRNVGCNGAGGSSETLSTVRVTDPRTRSDSRSSSRPSTSSTASSRAQENKRRQQEDYAKQQYSLYAEDSRVTPESAAVEDEGPEGGERQQRVYRGQPSTLTPLSRESIRQTSAVTNSIPASSISGGRGLSGDKGIVYSLVQQEPQQQQHQQQQQQIYRLSYPDRENSWTIFNDQTNDLAGEKSLLPTEEGSVPLQVTFDISDGPNDSAHRLMRIKRQISYRFPTGGHLVTAPRPSSYPSRWPPPSTTRQITNRPPSSTSSLQRHPQPSVPPPRQSLDPPPSAPPPQSFVSPPIPQANNFQRPSGYVSHTGVQVSEGIKTTGYSTQSPQFHIPNIGQQNRPLGDGGSLDNNNVFGTQGRVAQRPTGSGIQQEGTFIGIPNLIRPPQNANQPLQTPPSPQSLKHQDGANLVGQRGESFPSSQNDRNVPPRFPGLAPQQFRQIPNSERPQEQRPLFYYQGEPRFPGSFNGPANGGNPAVTSEVSGAGQQPVRIRIPIPNSNISTHEGRSLQSVYRQAAGAENAAPSQTHKGGVQFQIEAPKPAVLQKVPHLPYQTPEVSREPIVGGRPLLGAQTYRPQSVIASTTEGQGREPNGPTKEEEKEEVNNEEAEYDEEYVEEEVPEEEEELPKRLPNPFYGEHRFGPLLEPNGGGGRPKEEEEEDSVSGQDFDLEEFLERLKEELGEMAIGESTTTRKPENSGSKAEPPKTSDYSSNPFLSPLYLRGSKGPEEAKTEKSKELSSPRPTQPERTTQKGVANREEERYEGKSVPKKGGPMEVTSDVKGHFDQRQRPLTNSGKYPESSTLGAPTTSTAAAPQKEREENLNYANEEYASGEEDEEYAEETSSTGNNLLVTEGKSLVYGLGELPRKHEKIVSPPPTNPPTTTSPAPTTSTTTGSRLKTTTSTRPPLTPFRPTQRSRLRTTTFAPTTPKGISDSKDDGEAIAAGDAGRHGKAQGKESRPVDTSAYADVEVAINSRPAQVSGQRARLVSTPPTYNATTTTLYSSNSRPQYDPNYYALYDEEEVELYRDIDYGQVSGARPTISGGNDNYRGQNHYKVQQQIQQQVQQQQQQQQQQQPEVVQQESYLSRGNAYIQQQQPQQTYVQEEQADISYGGAALDSADYSDNYNTREENEQVRYNQAPQQQTSARPPLGNRNRQERVKASTEGSYLREEKTTSYPTTSKQYVTTSDAPQVYSMTPSTRRGASRLTAYEEEEAYVVKSDAGSRRGNSNYRATAAPRRQPAPATSSYPFTTQSGSSPSVESGASSRLTAASSASVSEQPLSQNSIETLDYSSRVREPSYSTNNVSSDAYQRSRSSSSSSSAALVPKEKPNVRIRPTTASPASQSTTVSSSRGSSSSTNRGRGNSPYSAASTSGRSRPTLKPSTAIVSKASDFIDVYRYPASRPAPVYPQPRVDQSAAKCRKDICLLPDCYCGGKDVPGGLEPQNTPQIVLLTFDDSVNDLNKKLYSDLFEKGRKNPNGCPISATFYVSHEWTDYSQVQNLYAAGHEMASHSISHSFGEQFSQRKWAREINGQREILAAYGGVKLEDVRGMRAPFLAVGGNKMFKMLYDTNFTYDSSMPVYENRPPSWPYTFDYKIFHDCMIPPCPTRSYPGVWEVPMVMWQDLNGGRCSMGDACSNPPTSDGVYKMLIKNFERHYTTNRAPFGLFYHAAWFTQPHHKEGFEAFLDTIVAMDDVWLVTNWQAIQWMRDATPLSHIKQFQPFGCDYPDRPRKCNNPKVCNLWHKSGVRYMRTCQPCPDVYPWTGKTGVRNSRVDNEIVED